MDTIIDKLPPSLQGWAVLGALVAGAIAWMLGARIKKQPPEPSDLEELHRLRVELGQAELRRDFEAVIHANRKSFFGELDRLEERLRIVEQSVAVLQAGTPRRH
jgi:hypothetical protein